jgi:hypothetical protein
MVRVDFLLHNYGLKLTAARREIERTRRLAVAIRDQEFTRLR